MRLTILTFIALIGLLPLAAHADDRLVRLYAPPELVETGLFKYILPRFTLKTQVRVQLADDPSQADMVIGEEGRALFTGSEKTWHMAINSPDHPGTERFADWLTGEIGRNTVFAYAPDGAPIFGPPAETERVVAKVELTGDAEMGFTVSEKKCARCHRIAPDSRSMTLGSTPSFSVLRSLPDWQERFTAFYALNPHPAFTLITDVSPPFDDSRPSPIEPITMTLDEVEAVLAYVARLSAADLGAPLAHQ